MIYLYIAIAGFVGAALRYMTGELFFRQEAVFPFATLSVNIIGTFLLSWFTFRSLKLPDNAKKAIGTGLLGSFTTFSTLSVETVDLVDKGALTSAFLYISVTIIGGLAAAVLGFRIGERREDG
ncbi:fluoride efflux transporter CrcB [Salimicrobium halophilum]|uniref:Fluoride-specific ion channel FluC n=1 Tax=Salimicrobium halophilum TaxID=86666 RepID=A0A1G8REU0_9BACI|nr:fluoride efflux transporter CrcB [Salimicrobium halophilum]SDJ15429.1 camphor resistance protein CrcB [Salimicrobium halophilum]